MTVVMYLCPPAHESSQVDSRRVLLLFHLENLQEVSSDSDLRAILNQILDCQLNELSARFHGDSYELMKSVATLLATACDSNLTEMTKCLNDAGRRFDISVTESELSVFLQHVARKRARGETFLKLLLMCWTCEMRKSSLMSIAS